MTAQGFLGGFGPDPGGLADLVEWIADGHIEPDDEDDQVVPS